MAGRTVVAGHATAEAWPARADRREPRPISRLDRQSGRIGAASGPVPPGWRTP